VLEDRVSKVLALVRANWLTALSYRVETFFSFAGLFIGVIPLYFVSHALQPMMAKAISSEAPEYFGFLIVGWVAFSFVNTAVTGLHGALSGEISTGSFEALLGTPTPIVSLLAGMTGQALSMNVIRAVVILTFGVLFGVHIFWGSALTGLAILLLIILAYLPFGIFGAALVLAFRATGPLPTVILVGSALLGGVYYPTQSIPSWLERLSVLVPLKYGLKSLRRTLLDGAPLSASLPDLGVLSAMIIVGFVLSLAAFSLALRYSKHAGTLAQY
jgi:ABC-2 type transport system permease protein